MLKEKVKEYFKKDAEIRKELRKYELHYPHDALNKRIHTLRKILEEIVDWASKIEQIKILQKRR